MSKVSEVAWDAVQLALVVGKVRRCADGEVDFSFTPEECARIVQAMQVLREGNK